MTKFCRFELRTTDVDAARAFYAAILGHDRAVIWPLHEQALARGARPHWLGCLGVDDLERATAAFVERGATRLGPAPATVGGGPSAVFRDPGGAVVALAETRTANAPLELDVTWHVLNTEDVTRAAALHRDLFGWQVSDRLERGPHVAFQQFAWHAGGPSVGALADIAGRPGVHPHWLFFFDVNTLDAAIGATRAAGGVVLDPAALPSGERICVCEDPQGGAFAFRERRPLP
jgi:hypothetical protein